MALLEMGILWNALRDITLLSPILFFRRNRIIRYIWCPKQSLGIRKYNILFGGDNGECEDLLQFKHSFLFL